ncbi:MAG: TIGR03668 family PPOX class F420-dependent oxidoreductase [Dehalococcoidia bacterium]
MRQWEAEFTDGLRVAHFGTIAPDGQPHLVPVCFGRVGERIVVAIDEKPKRGGKLARIANLERDARCSMLWDRYDEDWTRLAWVRADGMATVLAEGNELPEGLAALRGRYPQYAAMALEQLPLVVFSPLRTVSWRWQGEE